MVDAMVDAMVEEQPPSVTSNFDQNVIDTGCVTRVYDTNAPTSPHGLAFWAYSPVYTLWKGG